MLAHYHFTQQGAGHMARDMPCQDFSLTREVCGYVVAAEADGVGSMANSGLGAEIAVTSAVECVASGLSERAETLVCDASNEWVLGLLKQGFLSAAACIHERAAAEGVDVCSLDSTLSMAVYDGSTLCFGHIGDDGIVAMHADGRCAMVTTRHKGLDPKSVIPLRHWQSWQFGTVPDVAAFVMMTDGLLDGCVDREPMGNRVYLPFLKTLFYEELSTPERVKASRDGWDAFLRGPDATDACLAQEESEAIPSIRDTVKDDLTIVLVQNSDAVAALPAYSFDAEAWAEGTRKRQQELARAMREEGLARMRKLNERYAKPSPIVESDRQGVADESSSTTTPSDPAPSVQESGRGVFPSEMSPKSDKPRRREPIVHFEKSGDEEEEQLVAPHIVEEPISFAVVRDVEAGRVRLKKEKRRTPQRGRDRSPVGGDITIRVLRRRKKGITAAKGRRRP